MSDHKADGGKNHHGPCYWVDDQCILCKFWAGASPPSEPIHWDGIGYVEPEVTPERVEGPYKTEMIKRGKYYDDLRDSGPTIETVEYSTGSDGPLYDTEDLNEAYAQGQAAALAKRDEEVERLKAALLRAKERFWDLPCGVDDTADPEDTSPEDAGAWQAGIAIREIDAALGKGE